MTLHIIGHLVRTQNPTGRVLPLTVFCQDVALKTGRKGKDKNWGAQSFTGRGAKSLKA